MNIKNTLKVAALAGGIALFGFGTSVGAVTEIEYQHNSKASIEFVTDKPAVLDPENPGDLFEPEIDPDPGVTDDTGLLTLDYVSSFEFGKQLVSTTTETYESLTLRPFVQVSDRRGTGAGWLLTAELGEFKDKTDQPSLIGASITLSGGDVISPGGGLEPTLPAGPIELNSNGGAQVIVTANEGTGKGTWLKRWLAEDLTGYKNEKVTLTVPGSVATKGSHAADITWTLTNAPQ